MIYLPFPPTNIQLRSFWLVVSLMTGLATGVLLSPFASITWVAWGVPIAFALIVPGLLRPEIVSTPYRAFNKLARLYAHSISELLTLACFAIICVGAGNNASLLRLSRPSERRSFWVPRKASARGDHAKQNGVAALGLPQGSATSSAICELLLAPTAAALFDGDGFVNLYSDNIIVLARTRSEVGAIVETVGVLLRQNPAGLLTRLRRFR